jgi:hypothetical protein
MHFRLFTALLTTVLAIGTTAVVRAGEPVMSGDTAREGERGDAPSPLSVSGGGSFFARLGEPDRKGLALQLASSYDPDFRTSTVTTSFSLNYDHGQLWDRVRAGNKEFKLEGVFGAAVRPDVRTVVSINMMSLYYPGLFARSDFRPYLEAGIGAIYTDFQVDGQGVRLNFNPQLGIGAVLPGGTYGAVRLHHISNGSLNHNNQGVNSLLFQIGRFF